MAIELLRGLRNDIGKQFKDDASLALISNCNFKKTDEILEMAIMRGTYHLGLDFDVVIVPGTSRPRRFPWSEWRATNGGKRRCQKIQCSLTQSEKRNYLGFETRVLLDRVIFSVS